MCSLCLFIYFLDMDELKLFNSFENDFHCLGYANLVVDFLEILQAKNVANA